MFLFLFTIPLLFIPVSAQGSLKVGRFFNPPNTDPDDSGYANDPIWTIGETKTIQFTTTYSNYTIALWQQTLPGGSATLGPIIFQTSTGAVTQFDWIVQLFEFDLKASNVFFLWLYPGVASEQGSGEVLSVSSHYVNFTSSASSSSTTSTPTSSVEISLSPTALTTSHTSGTISVTGIASFAQTASSTATRKAASDGGLSTGAEAGIGIGVSLIGLAAIGGCGALIWHLRTKSCTSRGITYELDQNPKSEAPQSIIWGPTEAKWPARHSANIPAELPEQERAELG